MNDKPEDDDFIDDEIDFTEDDHCQCDPNDRIEKSHDGMRTWVCADCGGIIV